MKQLLYFVIVLAFIQACTSTDATSFRDKVENLYIDELTLLEKDYCENAKKLTEKLLKDKLVQQAASPVMQQFKQNLTDFLKNYDAYMRYNLTNRLVLLFEEKIPVLSNHSDSKYIWQLLQQHGYNDLNDDYQIEYMKFALKKFLPKFEQLKAQLAPKEREQQQPLLSWGNELKACRNYSCQARLFDRLMFGNSTAEEELLEFAGEKLDELIIFYGQQANALAKGILKSPQVASLEPALKQQLTTALNNFTKQYEHHQSIYQLYNLTQNFDKNILMKYYRNNTAIPVKERKLLKQIFDGQGCAKFLADYERKWRDFVKHDLVVKFKQFKDSLSAKELDKQKPLLQWYEKMENLNSSKDMMMGMLDEFYTE